MWDFIASFDSSRIINNPFISILSQYISHEIVICQLYHRSDIPPKNPTKSPQNPDRVPVSPLRAEPGTRFRRDVAPVDVGCHGDVAWRWSKIKQDQFYYVHSFELAITCTFQGLFSVLFVTMAIACKALRFAQWNSTYSKAPSSPGWPQVEYCV